MADKTTVTITIANVPKKELALAINDFNKKLSDLRPGSSVEVSGNVALDFNTMPISAFFDIVSASIAASSMKRKRSS